MHKSKNGNFKRRTTKTVLILSCLALLAGLPAKPAAQGKRPVAPRRVVEVIEKIQRTMVTSKYQHVTRVRTKAGEYFFDCSGMAVWILKRSAPGALKTVGRPNGRRPLARHFFNTIAKIEPGRRKGAWHRLENIASAGPGDVLAWIRPKWFPSKSTGHVAFILDAPRPNPGPVPGLLFRIADASKFRHEDDTRKRGETGFGIGTLLVPTDHRGRPLGYGWVGSETESDWVVPTELVIGRPLR
jgi:hypothetical protein